MFHQLETISLSTYPRDDLGFIVLTSELIDRSILRINLRSMRRFLSTGNSYLTLLYRSNCVSNCLASGANVAPMTR
jgi:hypothetical protein